MTGLWRIHATMVMVLVDTKYVGPWARSWFRWRSTQNDMCVFPLSSTIAWDCFRWPIVSDDIRHVFTCHDETTYRTLHAWKDQGQTKRSKMSTISSVFVMDECGHGDAREDQSWRIETSNEGRRWRRFYSMHSKVETPSSGIKTCLPTNRHRSIRKEAQYTPRKESCAATRYKPWYCPWLESVTWYWTG
jgi:hypothetical protein